MSNGCFQKIYPQIIHFNKDFHYKPSILGYHYFWKHPNLKRSSETHGIQPSELHIAGWYMTGIHCFCMSVCIMIGVVQNSCPRMRHFFDRFIGLGVLNPGSAGTNIPDTIFDAVLHFPWCIVHSEFVVLLLWLDSETTRIESEYMDTVYTIYRYPCCRSKKHMLWIRWQCKSKYTRMPEYTPQTFDIAPENRTSQKESSLPSIIFQGAMLNFRGVSLKLKTAKCRSIYHTWMIWEWWFVDSLANETSLFATNTSRRPAPCQSTHGPRDPQELERRKKAQQAFPPSVGFIQTGMNRCCGEN